MEYSGHLKTSIATACPCESHEISLRVPAKRKRPSGDDVPWTAARCNRLLRTITSRISILKRIAAIKFSTSNDLRKPGKEQKRTEPSKLPDPDRPKVDRPEPTTPGGNDPEWMPQHRHRAAARTYGIKARPNIARPGRGADLKPKAFRFPTPFVKRVLQAPPSGQSSDRDFSLGLDATTNILYRKPKSRQLPFKTTCSSDEAQRNLRSAFDSLLQQTKPDNSAPRTGARSLLSICTRKVPEYIELEEEVAASENEDFKDRIRDAVYCDLEQYGSASGWGGLRELVRAHGLRKMNEAIKTELLPDNIVETMIDHCRGGMAIDEEFRLIQFYANRAKKRFPSGNDNMWSNTAALRLCKSLRQYESTHLQFRLLAETLGSRGKAVTNVPQLDSAIWPELVSCFAQDPESVDAVRFLEVLTDMALETIASVSEDSVLTNSPLGSALRTIFCLLTAMALTSSDTPGSSHRSSNRLAATLQTIVSGVLLRRHSSPENLRANDQANELGFTLMLSSLALQASEAFVRSDIVLWDLNDFVLHTKNQQRSHNSHRWLSDFARDVSNCVARYESNAGRQLWEMLVKSFLNASNVAIKANGYLLRSLVMDSAEEYAHTYKDEQAEIFRTRIEACVRNSPSAMPSTTPWTNRKDCGFRWDDGLCEFIAVTPFTFLSKSRRTVGLPAHRTSLALEEAQKRNSAPTVTQSDALKISNNATEQQGTRDKPKRPVLAARANNTNSAKVTGDCGRRTECRDTPVIGKKTLKSGGTRMLKRSYSAHEIGGENDSPELQIALDRDELGAPTPVPLKRPKHSVRPALRNDTARTTREAGPKRGGLKRSLSAAMTYDLSEDELGF